MPDKLTDAEIKKALECCASGEVEECKNCPYVEGYPYCDGPMERDVLDLINRQQAEIERLEKENKLLIDNDVSNKYPNCVLVEKGRIYTRTLEDYDNLIGNISAEAYKEFAYELQQIPRKTVFKSEIRSLLKDKVGEDNV